MRQVLKFIKKNRGYFRIENTLMYLDFLDPIDREIILYQKFESEAPPMGVITQKEKSVYKINKQSKGLHHQPY